MLPHTSVHQAPANTALRLQAFVPGDLVLPQPDAGLGRAATASPAIAAQLAHLAQLSEQLKVLSSRRQAGLAGSAGSRALSSAGSLSRPGSPDLMRFSRPASADVPP